MELKNSYLINGVDDSLFDISKPEIFDKTKEVIREIIKHKEKEVAFNFEPMISVNLYLKLTLGENSHGIESQNEEWKKFKQTEISSKYVWVYPFDTDDDGNLIPIEEASGIVNFDVFKKVLYENDFDLIGDNDSEVTIDYIIGDTSSEDPRVAFGGKGYFSQFPKHDKAR